uniref:Uncharacterized protein n=1 Tax=Strigamia maritima TaxID=126957 RepID=T1IIJ3_STRMM
MFGGYFKMSTNNQPKRQSILKQAKSPNRSALQDLDLELNLQQIDETKTIRIPPRRVSFASKYQIKEFCVDSESLGISNRTEHATITGSDESSYNSTAVETSNVKLRAEGLEHLLIFVLCNDA